MNNDFQWTDQLVEDAICACTPMTTSRTEIKEFMAKLKSNQQPKKEWEIIWFSPHSRPKYVCKDPSLFKPGRDMIRSVRRLYDGIEFGVGDTVDLTKDFDAYVDRGCKIEHIYIYDGPVSNELRITGKGPNGDFNWPLAGLRKVESPKPEWEILAYSFIPLSDHLGKPIKISRYSYHWGNAERGSQQYAIRSVRRTSDGQVFTVRDMSRPLKDFARPANEGPAPIAVIMSHTTTKDGAYPTGIAAVRRLSDNQIFSIGDFLKHHQTPIVKMTLREDNDIWLGVSTTSDDGCALSCANKRSPGEPYTEDPIVTKLLAKSESKEPSDFVKAMSGEAWKDMPSLPWTTFNQRQQKTTREIALDMAIKALPLQSPQLIRNSSEILKLAGIFEEWLNRPIAKCDK